MKNSLVALLTLGLMFSNAVAGQESSTLVSAKNVAEEVINHRVALGETIVLIAKKYVIRPSDIYEFNPDAVEGISPGSILKIPVGRSMSVKDHTKPKQQQPAVKKDTVSKTLKANLPVQQNHTATVNDVLPQSATVTPIIVEPVPTEAIALPGNGVFEVKHQVKSGETLTSLSRRYNTTVSEITDANKTKLRNGLQIGQELVIPAGPTPETLEGVIVHEVKSGETLTGLARKYNTTIEVITEYNKRKLKHGLQAGQKLSIMPGQPE
ncbi:LysM peptidoglycan-binding domain-containing protein [Flavobacterium salilacus subsp. salilacus]|uniref:muramidase family protein n=1 Tax=Flavobacterium TaxID=237 RepID=UPI001074D8AD|nr:MULTISPECIES: LysM peptidoglycan-binding domain-containing protein [Flavobacterium]KAF2518434.1 LysM peptidoglycan-binding domain-containing protein [Flavobacterium salilacus subsp. salilacus]MBE1615071.1 LysM peptidoglycan-binding domain-containing protein [Flavobacterium sp. SaA2.13]